MHEKMEGKKKSKNEENDGEERPSGNENCSLVLCMGSEEKWNNCEYAVRKKPFYCSAPLSVRLTRCLSF
jgi:hypothetical protein